MKLAEEKKEKDKKIKLCLVTFVVIFLLVMFFIGSKSSKIDIEYSRADEGADSISMNEQKEENITQEEEEEEEEPVDHSSYTIDKRLFLIHEQEKGPSESKVVESAKDQSEVISKKEFDLIKTNSEVYSKSSDNEIEKPSDPIETPAEQTKDDTAEQQKAAIKPKLPVQPVVKTSGALDIPVTPSKVLIGKYPTEAEARKVQSSLTSLPYGAQPFIKKINSTYSIQIGSYDNYSSARAVAGQLKTRGYDAWILQ